MKAYVRVEAKFHVLSNSERDGVTSDGTGAMQPVAMNPQFNGSGLEDKFPQSLPDTKTQPSSPQEKRLFHSEFYPFQS
jgi:hypothetical protein